MNFNFNVRNANLHVDLNIHCIVNRNANLHNNLNIHFSTNLTFTDFNLYLKSMSAVRR